MDKALTILEYDRIKEQLRKENINELTSKEIDNLHPLFFYEEIKEKIDQTMEGYKLYTLNNMPSLTYLVDVSNFLEIVNKNGVLSLQEICEFANQLEVVIALKKYVDNKEVEDANLPYFKNFVSKLYVIYEVFDQIRYCVSPNFTLLDHASSKLKEIRQNIKKVEEGIKEKLNYILKNNSSCLQDNYIASRNNHLVLPVKADCKNQIKGIVIDISDTKSTYFIEPYAVTESNVKLETLHYEEEVEINRIIKALCEIINKYNHELLSNNTILSTISFMYLKGKYGIDNEYETATLKDESIIDIYDAYHPLINKEHVIKNNFFLGNNYNNLLVISGPNTGGKTVALKTVGLLVLMNQSGLPIPIKSGTLGVFRDIFVDIGDEQSIEQSLSGFSSHIANVSNIIDKVNKHSLVLLDELGSKTDPFEGQALAKAIIDYLERCNCIAMITTHYLSIKDYAKDNNSITLASMSFDEKDFKPTYHLLLNMVGRSYALEIASSLGLKKEIIDKAREFKSSSSNDLDALIDELSLKNKEEESRLNHIKEMENDLINRQNELANKENEYQATRQKMLDNIENEKEEMLEEAYKEINDIVQEFKKSTEVEYKPHLKNQALQKLGKLETIEKEDDNISFSLGDEVRLKSLGRLGKIKELKGNKVIVVTDNNTMIVPFTELEKATLTKQEKKLKNKIKTNMTRAIKSTPLSLNIIGYHVDEALIELKQYIDASVMASHETVTIIHGHGTGTLRKAVHEFLKSCRLVESFRLGNYNEGGVGVTIVTLKK